MHMPTGDRVRIEAVAVVDAAGVFSSPGAILVQNHAILAAGTVDEIRTIPATCVVDCSQAVVLPAFVNAHTHLDLTHIGPVPFNGSFRDWVDGVRAQRMFEADALVESVEQGITCSKVGGTGILGDIAGVGSTIPGQVLADSGMPGVSYIELFGIGDPRVQSACDQIESIVKHTPPQRGNMRYGLQPHAPYSCGEAVYRAALGSDWPVATHLAETLEEIRFVQDATGPLADLLRELGVWHESIRPCGTHPVDALRPVFGDRRIVAAHLNYVDDAHLDALAPSNVSVAYCPRASAYFGHPHEQHPAHRYREMLQVGINVALGTDSILCLGTPGRMSVLDEMRFLFERDATDPMTLLRMGTINGARALGVNPEAVMLSPGPTVGLLAIDVEQHGALAAASDAMRAVLESSAQPRWMVDAPPATIDNLFITDADREAL
jgi:cytosine/adenosine deaminase-related metal-dependent hydrolase